MTYEELILEVTKKSGLHSSAVRGTLFHLPDALLLLGVGDSVKTPMGVFRVLQSPSRNVVLPDGGTIARVPSKTVVKLKPGRRLQKVVSSDD